MHYSTSTSSEFAVDTNRLNVALSRQRFARVVVGHPHYLQSCPLLAAVFDGGLTTGDGMRIRMASSKVEV